MIEWPDGWGAALGREVLFVERLREKLFSTEQIEFILELIDTTCGHCRDNDKDCECWHDNQ